MTTYNLTVVNNSDESWDMYTFQKNPASSIGNPQLRSLAWFTKATAAQSTATFTWDLTYNFMWSETGTLIPGVVFRASQSFPADPSRNGVSSRNSAGNQAFLTYNASRNFFEYSTSSAIEAVPGATAGTLYVNSDATVPNGIASVGIGMSNAGTFALPALTNILSEFTPEPTYYVAAGVSVQQGEVLEEEVSNAAQIEFAGVTSLTATFNPDHTWTVSKG